MMGQPWRYVYASVAGTSHGRTGVPCQDAAECRLLNSDEGEVLVAVVADGAGSAARGEAGARLACDLFLDEMSALLGNGGAVEEVTAEFVTAWLCRFQNEVTSRAEVDGLLARAYACTLLAAVVGPNSAAMLQIGDGAIVYSLRGEPHAYHCMFWPQAGEYANQTYFATDPAAVEYLDHSLVDWRIDEIALFTDGLQRLALSFETRTAHLPFFGPMFAPVRSTAPGHASLLSSALRTYLDSANVNDRTDDDKSLVLATRQEIAARSQSGAAESALSGTGHSTPISSVTQPGDPGDDAL